MRTGIHCECINRFANSDSTQLARKTILKRLNELLIWEPRTNSVNYSAWFLEPCVNKLNYNIRFKRINTHEKRSVYSAKKIACTNSTAAAWFFFLSWALFSALSLYVLIQQNITKQRLNPTIRNRSTSNDWRYKITGEKLYSVVRMRLKGLFFNTV